MMSEVAPYDEDEDHEKKEEDENEEVEDEDQPAAPKVPIWRQKAK